MRTSLTALIALAVAATSVAPTAARADVDVVEVHVNRVAENAGATILIRPVLVVGDGVRKDVHHVEGTAVGAYHDTVTATLDSLGIHGVATGSQTTSIIASGDTLTISSTASISGSKTISGVVKTDQGSGANDAETCNVSFKISKPSVYSFTATMSYTGAGGGQVSLPDGEQVEVPSGFRPVQLSIVRTGHLGQALVNGQPVNFLVRLSGGTGIGTIAPPVTEFGAAWSFTFDVRPDEPPGDDIRWTKTSGGAFGTDVNWNPQQVPVKDLDHNDNAIFDVAGGYSVDFAPAKTKSLGPPRHDDRLEILEGAVTFQSANLTVDELDLVRPSLTVDSAKLTIASGHVTSNSATIGSAHAEDAEVRVDGQDSLWNCLGRLRIGGAAANSGTGRLTITSGAAVTSVDTRIGAGAQSGTARVSGTGSTWSTDNIAVGFSGPGNLVIEDGAVVTSAIADVGAGFAFNPAAAGLDTVSVSGADAAGTSSAWNVTTLNLGEHVLMDVSDGAHVRATSANVFGAFLAAGGLGQGHPAEFQCSSLAVGSDGDVTLGADAGLFVSGILEIGSPTHPGGHVIVDGTNAASPVHRPLLSVGNLMCVGGGPGNNVLQIAGGGGVASGAGGIAFGPGLSGVVRIAGAESSWIVSAGPFVIGDAADSGSSGRLVFDGGLLEVTAGDVLIEPTGSVEGSGTLVAGGAVRVFGSLSPAISQEIPLEPVAAKTGHPAPRPAATLTIQGGLVVGATGVVRVDAGGPESDHVVVTGDATLGGTLVLQFMNGYAPRAGEHFDVVRVGGQTTGDFAAVDVRGLAPGAQFTTSASGGTRTLTAMNRTVALPTVSIKAAAKRAKEKSKKPVVLTFSRKGDASQALTVSYAVGGTAGNGLDCVTLPGAITIPARKRSAKVKLVLVDDFRHEGDETVVVTVLPGANYTHALASTARVTIADND